MGSDFNGDGRDDILWRYREGDYYLTWHGMADGGYLENGGLLATQVPGDWQVWGLGDFNGDARDDVLWRHSSGLVTNWLGNADATFTNNHLNSATAMSVDWMFAGTADFNGDRRADVLWRHADGSVSSWLGTANGGFIANPAGGSLIPNDWFIVGTGDFNGDGRDDILWRHSSGLVTNWLGNADATFTNNHLNSATQVPNDWNVMGTGDFDGDGRDDVLWQHESRLISNWLGTADGGFANNHSRSATMLNPNSSLVIITTGDFNGDGRDDLFLRNGEVVTNWLATETGGFVDNSHVSAHYIDYLWSVEPNPWGVGWWDY